MSVEPYVTANVKNEDQLNVLHLMFGIVNIRKHIFEFDAKTLIHMFPVIVILQVYSIRYVDITGLNIRSKKET